MFCKKSSNVGTGRGASSTNLKLLVFSTSCHRWTEPLASLFFCEPCQQQEKSRTYIDAAIDAFPADLGPGIWKGNPVKPGVGWFDSPPGLL